jgi:hypothetical protein
MRCTCFRWLLPLVGILLLSALPLLAQVGSVPDTHRTDSAAHALHRADTTRADSSGFVHQTYMAIQSAFRFLRRVADPVIHFFERLWHTITKETSDHDSILRFPLGSRKS